MIGNSSWRVYRFFKRGFPNGLVVQCGFIPGQPGAEPKHARELYITFFTGIRAIIRAHYTLMGSQQRTPWEKAIIRFILSTPPWEVRKNAMKPAEPRFTTPKLLDSVITTEDAR